MARRGRPSKSGDDDQTDLHIIMQLRKVINLQGMNIVHFRNGDQTQLPVHYAQKIINYYNSLPRPLHKDEFQQKISYSFAELELAVQGL